MEIRLEAKTLAIGVLLGAMIAMVLGLDGNRDRATGRLLESTGAGIPEKADFAVTMGMDGAALIRDQNGYFFIVSPKNGMAVRVLQASRQSDTPIQPRDGRGRPLKWSVSESAEEPETTGGYGK